MWAFFVCFSKLTQICSLKWVFWLFLKWAFFVCFSKFTQKLPIFIQQLNLSSSPRWAVFVSFSSSHPVIWKNTQKLPTIWDACITTNMWANFVFFSNSPPVIWKNTQNLPTSGRSINTVFPWWAIFVWFSSPYLWIVGKTRLEIIPYNLIFVCLCNYIFSHELFHEIE